MECDSLDSRDTRNSPDPRLESCHHESVSLSGTWRQSQRRVHCCGGERKGRGIEERENALPMDGGQFSVALEVGLLIGCGFVSRTIRF